MESYMLIIIAIQMVIFWRLSDIKKLLADNVRDIDAIQDKVDSIEDTLSDVHNRINNNASTDYDES